jgi:predicted RNA-binding protein with EMAP domain
MAIKKTIEIDVNSQSLGQLEEMLEDVNEELKDLDRNSDAFKEAAKKSQLLTKEIETINNEIEGFNLDDKIQAADGAAKVFAGSLSAAVGTLGTLGIESEAFGEFEQKAASAIAVGLGIKDVSEGFGQVAIAAKKSGIATKLFGSVTKTALVATGIGAFAVALGLIVANWDSITQAVKRFASNVPFIGKAIDAVKNTFNNLFDAARPVLEFLGILPDEAERAIIATQKASSNAIQQLEREIAIAQAAGVEAKKLFDLRKQLLEAELQQLRDSNAEKEEIFKKETELLSLEAAEQKRIREESAGVEKRERVETVNAITQTDKEILDSKTNLYNNEVALAKITEEQKADLAMKTLGDISSIVGENTAVGKAAGIAQATINSYLGFTQVLAAPSTLPEPFGSIQKGISAAAILASGLQTVKQITSTKTPQASGGAGGGSAPPQPPRFNIVGAAPENQLADVIGQNDQKPVKAFVVSNEISNQQQLDRNITEEASIG